MSLAPPVRLVLRLLGTAALSGLAPALVALACLPFLHGEAGFVAVPTLLLGPPLSAVAGLVVGALALRLGPGRLSAAGAWALAAAGAGAPGLVLVHAELGAVTPWVAAPFLAGAAAGAVPVALLARTRAAAPPADPAPPAP